MANQVSQEEMAAMQAQAGKSNDTPITKLVQDVGQGLSKLAEVLNSSDAATDQDKEQMSGIMSAFMDLVEKQLGGSGPGQNQEAESLSQVPVQQGAKGVPMGPQVKQ